MAKSCKKSKRFLLMYSVYEERILRILARGRRKLSTNKVSGYSKISYNATKLSLEKLYRKKKVKRNKVGNIIYWSV
jgi:hypothetical protein